MNRLAPLLVFSAVTAAAACKHDASNYCEDVPVTHNCMDDADTGCSSNAQCSGATPVCDVGGSKACVQCTTDDATACTGAMPVCGANNTCERCTMHAQCLSDVCLPDGSCSDGGNVAYVAPTGSGSACTKATPCGTLAAAITTNKPIVKMAAGLVKDTTTTTIDGKAITILADPGAKLDRDGDGPILEVKSANADVKVYDLEITGASGASGADGIQLTPNGGTPKLALTRAHVTGNQGNGIASTGGALTALQSTIGGNAGGGITASGGTLNVSQSTISGNTGGGITLSSAEFTIVNNFIVANGGGTSGLGGVKIDTITTAGTHQMDFNTITANLGPATVNTGVSCGTVTIPLTFDSNIVYGNSVSAGGKQFGGSINCLSTYSDIGPDVVSGTGNINLDPHFVDLVGANYHLTSTSPCKDAASPTATLNIDFDGETRPKGTARDIGADEY